MSQTFSKTLRVRYRDTDAQGHMFFANYLVFADEVAGRYMETLGFDWSHPDRFPSLVFTVNVNCDYLHECLSGDLVRVDVAYRKIGNSSARLGFELTREADGQALARGEFTQVFVDRETRRPIPVPDTVRAALAESDPV
jgi:acyl-CoA thioester hydrolase